jgi:hypothetical protein
VAGNLPGVVMRAGENVRWYLAGKANDRCRVVRFVSDLFDVIFLPISIVMLSNALYIESTVVF